MAIYQRIMQILDELDSLDASNMSDENIMFGSPIILGRMEECSRLMDMVNFKRESRRDFDELRKTTASIAHLVVEFKHQATREVRLANRQALRAHMREHEVMTGTVCSVEGCNRQARVNEYCKRHAREKGIIVKGKIT
jgi:hypothetical protein